MEINNNSQLIVGIIPARGGSKSIPKKNIIDFCGHPLLAWSILQAKASKYLDEIYVSTDDQEIADVAIKYGAKVIKRPEDISGDTATSESALLHSLDKIEEGGKKIKYIVFLQATSPIREPVDIDNAVEAIEKEKADSLFSAVNIGDFCIWEKKGDKLESINYDYHNRKRRQDFDEQYGENGSIYVFTPEVLRRYNNRFGGKIGFSEMEFWKKFEIDDYEDLEFCKTVFKSKNLDKIINNISMEKEQSKTTGRVVWWNGKFVPESEARISVYDSALMFGDMVFEMTRSFNKKQFKLREHLERLYSSIRHVRIPLKMTMDEMERHIYETIEANEHMLKDDDEHRIMVDVSRGLLGIYENTVDCPAGPNVIIADFPLRWTVANMGHLYDTGINAIIPSQRAIPASLLDPKTKNRSRLHYLMANIEVSLFEGKDNWALLLDPDGYIAEGTGDNFFIVKDRVIITPEPRNILRGISRGYIFDLGRQLGLQVVEKNIEPYDVYNADEAFMTATPFCVLPVATLNGEKIGETPMGPITKLLLDTWSQNVEVDIPGQIKKWDQEMKEGAKTATPYEFKR